MKCPHCQVSFHSKEERFFVNFDINYVWNIAYEKCPSCEKSIINLFFEEKVNYGLVEEGRYLIYPKLASYIKAPKEVPKHIAEDFNEAGLILNDSPKASAALSRRCLQAILREIDGIKSGSLDAEINQAIELFPSHISEAIDAVRNIGNFAAHPKKSESTGEIIAVEAGEAEWAIQVLEQLFDFCYVQPKILEQKRNALNAKLADIGKPPLKSINETK